MSPLYIPPGGTVSPGGTTWGSITGVLSGQADLSSALASKESANANIQGHIISLHAPSNAQKNSDITKEEIEAKLTGTISSHLHSGGADPFIAKLVLLEDKSTGGNTTPVTLGLSFDYEVNSKYVIDMYILVAPSIASVGCGFALDVSSIVTYIGTFVAHQLAASGTLSGSGSIGDRGATSLGVSSGMVSTSITLSMEEESSLRDQIQERQLFTSGLKLLV